VQNYIHALNNSI